MPPILRKIVLAISAIIYWLVAAPAALIIGLQIEYECDFKVSYLTSCGLSKFAVPILFTIFMTLYTSVVWVLARRTERTEAEADRLAEDALLASNS